MAKNIFETMNTTLKKNTPPVDEIDNIPKVIYNKWLASSVDGIFIANYFNVIGDMPMVHRYRFAKNILRKKGVNKIYYLKDFKDDEEVLKSLMFRYKISRNVAKEYRNMLDDNVVKRILNEYKEYCKNIEI